MARGTCALELDLGAIIASSPVVRPAPEFSTHPVAKEDFVMIVGPGVTAAEVEQVIRTSAGALLESLRLFDVYQGPQIPEGCRSLAFSLHLRAPDRTLSASEIASVREAVIARTSADLGAKLR